MNATLRLSSVACALTSLALPGFHAQGCDLTETVKLLAADADQLDYFGQAVGIEGDLAIVGAHKDEAAASSGGSAYLFRRSSASPGSAWTQIKKLTASDAQDLDFFGAAVDVSGDYAFVGAWGDDDLATGAGAAYIFARNHGGPDNWGELLKLTSPDGGTQHNFGRHLAASGDTLVVTSQGDTEFGPSAGAMYVFQRDQGGSDAWGLVQKRVGSDVGIADYFGISVGLDGDTAIVGAYGHDGGLNNTGAAYVFQRDFGGANHWGEVRKLTASDAELEDQFGASVAIDGDSAIVSANFEDSGADTGGAVYFFERDAGGPDAWGEVAKRTASDAEFLDQLGYSVAIEGDVALASSILTDDGGSSSGSAYIFRRDLGGANQWGEAGVLRASDATGSDNFGEQVALSGGLAIAGAPSNQDFGPATGSAYLAWVGGGAQVVRLGSPPNPAALLPGVTQAPNLGATWDPVIDHTTFLPGATLDVLGITVTALNLSVPPLGTLLCDPGTSIATVTGAAGVPFSVPIPNDCMFVGTAICSQGASVDAFGTIRFANALDLVIGAQ